jgi:hypothetical protein
MALNETRTHVRTAQDELADMELAEDNLLKESWKSWPNKAGVTPPLVRHTCICVEG